MSDPVRFLTSLAQALSTMALYKRGHPARSRAIDASYHQVAELQRDDVHQQFSFLGDEIVYGQLALRELKDWEWGLRLGNAGIQRIELVDRVGREEYEAFLESVLARLAGAPLDTSEARQERAGAIRYGAIGIRGEGRLVREVAEERVPTATIAYSLGDEVDAIRWLHEEVGTKGSLPIMEAESVVRSLAVAMHGESQVVLPLLQLKEFDQYTTTHSLNVSVLTMGLAEYMGLSARDVRAFGVAGLLHDLGKVRIPREILVKPGRLNEQERIVMQRHPVDGARIIFASDKQLDLAAVVAYEHHIMINGQGYPGCHYHRDCHKASMLVHVCDVYDALRTTRPYRDAWESERALKYIEERAGVEFHPEIAHHFVAMMRQWDKRLSTLQSPAEGTPAADVQGADGRAST